jgi:hypothetical protein
MAVKKKFKYARKFQIYGQISRNKQNSPQNEEKTHLLWFLVKLTLKLYTLKLLVLLLEKYK